MTAADDRPDVELAREVIGVLAPREMSLFAASVRAAERDPTGRSISGGMAAGGVEFGGFDTVTFLTPIVLAAAAEVVKFLALEIGRDLSKEAAGFIVRRLIRREPDAVRLTSSQVEQVRAIVLKVGTGKKLAPAQAAAMAAAVARQLTVGA